MKKNFNIFILCLLVVGVGFYLLNKYLLSNQTPKEASNNMVQNVSMVDGKQIINISAKSGYVPRVSYAKANLPTILRFDTSGTFDCSASVNIPSINISKVLPNSGQTDIDLGSPKLGKMQGMCSMGMYPFEIIFN